MRLFGERGFKGTSVTQIETAAGLAPGAGGIYHHFSSKNALLAAGIERHVNRISALSDIRRLFSGLGDLRMELVVIGRYVLSELESEQDLLRVMVLESRNPLVEEALNGLVDSTLAEFTGWLADAAGLPTARAAELSRVAFGALLSWRLLPGAPLPADVHAGIWADMVMAVAARRDP
jgi:AcrR family transcriptional regulator